MRLLHLFVLAGLLALSACAPPLPQSHTWAGLTCERVVDGDTIKVRHRGTLKTIRILGIDTLEIGESSKRARQARRFGVSENQIAKWGRAAAALGQRDLHRKDVSLSFQGDEPGRDDYGRILAYVHTAEGDDFGLMLLDKGLADIYRTAHPRRNAYEAARRDAQAAGRGIWAP